MSRASRDLVDGGDRRQDCNTNNDTRRAPILFLDARNCDTRTNMPRALAELADRRGKHRDNLRYELALLWRRFMNDGEFRVSMRMIENLYTSHFRREFKEILDATATPVKTHSSFPGSIRSRTYKFRFRRPKKAPIYNDIPEDEPVTPKVSISSTVPSARIRVTIPAAWLWDRYERWADICKRNDWTSSLDLDGRTDWGRPLFATLDSVLIPETTETARLTKQGVVKIARRKRGRCYHVLTNLRKNLRREILIDGEPVAEVDIHACYSALLISKLRAGKAKDKAIEALRSDWYSQFQEAYAEWFRTQLASGRGYIGDDGRWMLRMDDDPSHDVPASIKVEYQRQCLFWRDPRDSSNPLRVTLRQLHPELCSLIESRRSRMTPTQLSDVLTRAEGRIVVDCATSELERAGIKSCSIHDAVVVPVSRVDDAYAILLDVCQWHLGFAPRVSKKTATPIIA